MSIRLCKNLSEIPAEHLLADCAVSGGTLEDFLRAALRLSGGKLCLRLVPQALAFPLPCMDGLGSPVSPRTLKQLKATHACHYAPALVTNYLSYEEQGQLHILLFDTPETLQKKQALAEELGVPLLLMESE